MSTDSVRLNQSILLIYWSYLERKRSHLTSVLSTVHTKGDLIPAARISPEELRGDREWADSHYFQVQVGRCRCSPNRIPAEHRKTTWELWQQEKPKCCLELTSPLSTTARDEVWPHTMLTATLFCRQLDTRRGVGWLAVEPEPTWPQLL